MEHKCARCPHDLTVVTRWENEKWVTYPIVDLSDEDLLLEYAANWESDGRRVSEDPPTPLENLYEEVLRRMRK